MECYRRVLTEHIITGTGEGVTGVSGEVVSVELGGYIGEAGVAEGEGPACETKGLWENFKQWTDM